MPSCSPLPSPSGVCWSHRGCSAARPQNPRPGVLAGVTRGGFAPVRQAQVGHRTRWRRPHCPAAGLDLGAVRAGAACGLRDLVEVCGTVLPVIERSPHCHSMPTGSHTHEAGTWGCPIAAQKPPPGAEGHPARPFCQRLGHCVLAWAPTGGGVCPCLYLRGGASEEDQGMWRGCEREGACEWGVVVVGRGAGEQAEPLPPRSARVASPCCRHRRRASRCRPRSRCPLPRSRPRSPAHPAHSPTPTSGRPGPCPSPLGLQAQAHGRAPFRSAQLRPCPVPQQLPAQPFAAALPESGDGAHPAELQRPLPRTFEHTW